MDDEKPKNDGWKGLLSRLGKDVEKALHEAAGSPTGQKLKEALDDAGPQLKKAVEQVGPGLQKLVDEVRPQVQKVVEQVGPEMKKALDQARPVVKGALDELLGKPAAPREAPPPAHSDVPPNVSPDAYTPPAPEEAAEAEGAGEADDADTPADPQGGASQPEPVKKTVGRGPKTRKPDPAAKAAAKKTLGRKKPE